MTGAELIARERKRQIEGEGWDAEHDDEHTDGSLALAAVCYATPVRLFKIACGTTVTFEDPWPESWEMKWDKRRFYGEDREDPHPAGVPIGDPADPATYTYEERLDLLVKAGALIAAEIDRLNRVQRARRPRIDKAF